MKERGVAMSLFSVLLAACQTVFAAPLPIVKEVEWQPFAAQVKRLIDATDYIGSPLSAEEKNTIETALAKTDSATGIETVQSLLDQHCLFGIQINP